MINNVRRIRRSIDLTQEELAKKIGTNRSYICELEKGRISSPSVYRCYEVADALGVDVETAFPRRRNAK